MASEPASRSTAPDGGAIDRYGVRSSNDRLVDNKGEGHEALYGVRNFRAVIANTLYRGGGNNSTNRYGKRPNRNPLPAQGLENLCREGFDTAVYMYSEGFADAPKKVSCIDRRTGKSNTLDYLQMGPYKPASIREMLELVHRKAKDGGNGNVAPVYFHCWNGWHASGLIAAYALRQFCDYSGDQAIAYWNLNTDGNDRDPNFEKLRKQMRDFRPYSDLRLSPAERERLCLPMKSS